MQIGQIQRMFTVPDKFLRLFVIEFRVLAKNLRGPDSQGAIQIDRHIGWQFALLSKEKQAVYNLLGAFHGKGRNDNLFPLGVTILDSLGQFLQTVFFIRVISVAVSGFQKNIIGMIDITGVCNNKLLRTAKITGEYGLGPFSVLLVLDFNECRAKNMPCILVGDRKSVV